MTDEYLFISDCHLDENRPDITAAVARFISARATAAQRLYILGDLFEVWLGDDEPAAGRQPVIDALKHLVPRTDVYFIPGNRDFLLGPRFAQQTGLTLLDEPLHLTLGQQRIILMHGDTLCTDDTDYQTFRQRVRTQAWQSDFLERPLVERQQIAAQLRRESASAMAQKSPEIMDVNAAAVQACFDRHQVDTIIHGHTHRPAIHRYPKGLTRYVLGDWNPTPSYLSWNGDTGFKLVDPRVY